MFRTMARNKPDGEWKEMTWGRQQFRTETHDEIAGMTNIMSQFFPAIEYKVEEVLND
jgi:hypothetical protein